MIINTLNFLKRFSKIDNKCDYIDILDVCIGCATDNESFKNFLFKYAHFNEYTISNFLIELKTKCDLYENISKIIETANKDEPSYEFAFYIKEIVNCYNYINSLDDIAFMKKPENKEIRGIIKEKTNNIVNSINLLGIYKLKD